MVKIIEGKMPFFCESIFKIIYDKFTKNKNKNKMKNKYEKLKNQYGEIMVKLLRGKCHFFVKAYLK